MKVKELQERYNETAHAANAIQEKAAAESRSLTTDEHAQLLAHVDTAKAIKADIDRAKEAEVALGQLRSLGMPAPTDDEGAPAGTAKSLGEAFVQSDGYKAVAGKEGKKGGSWSTGPVELPYDSFGAKTTLTELTGSGGQLIQPDVQPGILPILFRRLVVADLMMSGQTTSNTVRYLKESSATNAAATVVEANAKPESTLVFALVDEPVRKIATFLPISDEMLEDWAQARSFIDQRLELFVKLTEEDQLLNGNGTPPNILGVLNRTGLQGAVAKGAGTWADAIISQKLAIQAASFIEPTGMVVNPSDWSLVLREKDANGQYFGAGPFTGAYGNGNPGLIQYWGMTVVVTPAIAAGTILVGAFALAAQVFRRSGISVEASNSHQDFFQKNLTALRAEERLALAVYRPNAFGTVTP